MYRPVLLLAAVAVLPTLSGCLDGIGGFGGDEHRPIVSPPRTGDLYSYLGSDGTNVTVRIEGLGDAQDRYGVTHPAIMLEFTIRPAEQPEMVLFVKEAVALHGGMIVNQEKDCVWPSSEIDNECGDVVAVYFVPSGLPGALGGAPFWHRHRMPSEGTFQLDTPLPQIDGLSYRISERSDACMTLQYEPEGGRPLHHDAWVPATVLYEPARFCEGVPLPTVWRPTTEFAPFMSERPRPVFRLVDWTPGEGDPVEVTPWSAADAAPPAPPVPLKTWEGDFLVADEAPFVPFTTIEAYREARRLDVRFDEAADNGSLLVYNEFFHGGGSSCCTVPVYDSRVFGRTLGLQPEEGPTYFVRVTKTSTSSIAGHDPPPEYAILDSWTEDLPHVDPAVVTRAAADPRAALEFATRVHGHDIVSTFYTFTTRELDIYGSASPRSDGYRITVVAVPDLDEQTVARGHRLSIDGPSGTLVLLERAK